MLWRLAVLMSLYKRGSPMNHGSWRLIFVKCQMGLLQEALLTERLVMDVYGDLVAGQSGYIRGVEPFFAA